MALTAEDFRPEDFAAPSAGGATAIDSAPAAASGGGALTAADFRPEDFTAAKPAKATERPKPAGPSLADRVLDPILLGAKSLAPSALAGVRGLLTEPEAIASLPGKLIDHFTPPILQGKPANPFLPPVSRDGLGAENGMLVRRGAGQSPQIVNPETVAPDLPQLNPQAELLKRLEESAGRGVQAEATKPGQTLSPEMASLIEGIGGAAGGIVPAVLGSGGVGGPLGGLQGFWGADPEHSPKSAAMGLAMGAAGGPISRYVDQFPAEGMGKLAESLSRAGVAGTMHAGLGAGMTGLTGGTPEEALKNAAIFGTMGAMPHFKAPTTPETAPDLWNGQRRGPAQVSAFDSLPMDARFGPEIAPMPEPPILPKDFNPEQLPGSSMDRGQMDMLPRDSRVMRSASLEDILPHEFSAILRQQTASPDAESGHIGPFSGSIEQMAATPPLPRTSVRQRGLEDLLPQDVGTLPRSQVIPSNYEAGHVGPFSGSTEQLAAQAPQPSTRVRQRGLEELRPEDLAGLLSPPSETVSRAYENRPEPFASDNENYLTIPGRPEPPPELPPAEAVRKQLQAPVPPRAPESQPIAVEPPPPAPAPEKPVAAAEATPSPVADQPRAATPVADQKAADADEANVTSSKTDVTSSKPNSSQSESPKPEIKGDPSMARGWLSALPSDQQQLAFSRLRFLDDRASNDAEIHSRLRGDRQGKVPVGAAAFDPFLKSEVTNEFLREIHKGSSPEVARDNAKAFARVAIEKHNAKRSAKDYTWQRWEGSGDSAVDSAYRTLTENLNSDAIPPKASAVERPSAAPAVEGEAAGSPPVPAVSPEKSNLGKSDAPPDTPDFWNDEQGALHVGNIAEVAKAMAKGGVKGLSDLLDTFDTLGKFTAYRPEKDKLFSVSPAAAGFRDKADKSNFLMRKMEGDLSVDHRLGQKQLTAADRNWAREHFEEYIASGKPMPNPRLQRYADAWRTIQDKGASKAESIGKQVETAQGGKRPFQRLENYFPHVLTPEAREALVTKQGPIFDALTAAAKKANIDLSPYLKENASGNNERKAGAVDFERLANLPAKVTGADGTEYQIRETDPFKVIERHISNVSRRLANAEVFGEGDQEKIFNEIRDKAVEESGRSDATKVLDHIWRNMQGNVRDEINPIVRNAFATSRAAQLSLSGLSNAVGGLTIPVARFGARNTARSAMEAAYGTIADKLGMNSGAIGEHLQQAERNGAWRKDMLDYISGTEGISGRAARGVTKLSQTENVNRQINKVSALAAERAFFDFLGDKSGDMQLKTEFGFNDADLARMRKDGPTPDDIARVHQQATTKSNVYMESGLTKPPSADDKYFRRVLSYTSYARAVGWAVADAAKYAANGNVKPLARLLIGGTLSGAALHTFRNWLTGRTEEDKDWYWKLMDWANESSLFGMGGAVGSDAYYSFKLGRDMSGIPQAQWWTQNVKSLLDAIKATSEDGPEAGGEKAYLGLLRAVPAFKVMNHLAREAGADSLPDPYPPKGSGSASPERPPSPPRPPRAPRGY